MSHSFLWQQSKLLSWSITLHKIKPHGPLRVVTDSFLFHFKPWVTEVKYSDPSLHLASKGGIQPLCTVGTAASKDMASILTGKCLQHTLITSRGRQDFPRGSLWAQAQSTPPSTTLLWLRSAEAVGEGLFCKPFRQAIPLGCGGFLGGTWEDTHETFDIPDLYRYTLK